MRQKQFYMNDISDPKGNSMHIMHQCVRYKLVYIAKITYMLTN